MSGVLVGDVPGLVLGPTFWKAVLLGLSVAAPVGPIGLLCIRRTLSEGRMSGFASGLGAATADALYGAVAAFGLAALTALLLGLSFWLQLLGGLFLVWMGWQTFKAVPADSAPGGTAPTPRWGVFGTTFLLTVGNPMTILSFTAIFAGLGFSSGGGPLTAVSLVMGIFLGSALWWLLLALGVGMLAQRLEPGGLRWVNRLSGAMIAAYGFVTLATLH